MEEMKAYRCKKCQKLHHPRYIVCQNPDCDGRAFDELPLGGACRLLTWTRVYNLPEGYTMPWLNFGIVEFESGVRATGQIGFDDGIVSGMPLIAEVGVVRNARILYKETVECEEYGFVFRKV